MSWHDFAPGGLPSPSPVGCRGFAPGMALLPRVRPAQPGGWAAGTVARGAHADHEHGRVGLNEGAAAGARPGLVTGEDMDASLLAVLTDAERLLVAETDRDALATLDENGAIALETRIRRARDKYVGQYRQGASGRVAERGGRGRARPENSLARAKAEAFERALAQVSRRVAVLARQSAAELRAERLAAAKAVRQRDWPGAGEMVPRQRRQGPDATPEPTGERALRNPASEKERAGTLAQGARRQARRDSKRAGAR
jgi:hypothetical protein